MKAVYLLDTYFSRAPGGAVYAHGAFPYEFWAERFLPHFDDLTVIGREKPYHPMLSHEFPRSDGPHVRFVLLESISSPAKLLFGAGEARTKIREEVGQADAVIVRGPSEFGMIAAKMVKLTSVNKPVAIEMSGCAYDHMRHHGSLTGRLYAPIKLWRARKMVNDADYVLYVTKMFLQSRYPATGTTANASNVEIEPPSSDILARRIRRIEKQRKVIFGLIGNYENKLKGVDIALAAFTRALGSLPPFEFRVLGHGPKENEYESFVRYNRPTANRRDVMEWLDNIDVYLQPSRHEGLPRALIEAMSRACPALGSDAGGIPELLGGDCIHPAGDVHYLAQHIIKSVDKNWQKQQATNNFDTSALYSREILVPIRDRFWGGFANLARGTNSELAGQPQYKNIFVKVGT